jgi:3'-5' exoribonuclease
MTNPSADKGPFVESLRPGERITGFFLVRQKKLEPFRDRNKGEFLSLLLADRTGDVMARVWEDAPELAEQFAEGDIIKVAADVGEYQGRLQLVVQKLRRASDDEFDLGDFQPGSQRDAGEMLDMVRLAVDGLQEPYLAALVRSFFDDPMFINRLVRAPAARRVHHAYVGGLLEQLCEMLALAGSVAQLYPAVNADLLTSGILLHSLGKLAEYAWSGDISYTDEGRLLGHIVLSAEQVAGAIAGIEGFPVELGLRVRHMLVSQHGRYEWGSPRQPQTLEAVALHHIENLTAQISRFNMLLDSPREPGQTWTEYNRLLGRQLYIGLEPQDRDGESRPPE